MDFARRFAKAVWGQRLPVIEGTLDVPGVHDEVLIRRDRWGVPHIEAEHDADAWYAVGFCQGQDRCFQLEALKRVANGTLAELVGRSAVPVDRLARRIGFGRIAKTTLEVQTPAARALLEAFAAGVSSGARRGLPRRAHEFAALRRDPTAFAAADILAIVALNSFLLASNWDVELARAMILQQDGEAALLALDPSYAEHHPVTYPPGQASGPAAARLLHDLEILRTVSGGGGGGSNNWAVDGTRTRSGKPLLANDPHLPPLLPAHWYLAHVTTPRWQVAGAGFVGAPGIPVGHNGHAAWGVTAALIDNTDLFAEEVGEDGLSVRGPGGFAPCACIDERIEVRGAEAVIERVLITQHGPIVGPALEGEVGSISMRATWMQPATAHGLLEVHTAHSFERFREHLQHWPAIPLNMVYADASGTIGWQLAGRAPKRKRGFGMIPLPAWMEGVGWEDDPVPFESMPWGVRPSCGYVATANNNPEREGDVFLGADWLEGYRAARIVEALHERSDWDVPSMLALQVDHVSLLWRELREPVLAALTDADVLAVERALLSAWDGVVGSTSAAASVFELFVADMAQRVVKAKAPRSAPWMLGQGFAAEILPFTLFGLRRGSHLARLLAEQPEGWFDGGWANEIRGAVVASGAKLRAGWGPHPSAWAWGNVRPLELRHPFGKQKPFAKLFNLGPIAWAGDTNTVAQASVNLLDPTSNPMAIASLRVVIDLADIERSRFALPGGQSGNPMSPHYADLFDVWGASRGVPIAWSKGAVQQATRATLRLVPG